MSRSSPASRPIFIFGSPRSGTSLVSRILNAHSRIGIPYESLIYDTFFPIRAAYGDLAEPGNVERLIRHVLRWGPMAEWKPRVEFDSVMSHLTRRDFHGVFEAVLETWAASCAKVRWGEKSPWHAFYWRAILEGFPEAQFIHVVRDPRDASLSWKRARQGPRNTFVLARRWAGYVDLVADVRSNLPPERFHQLHYESLLDDPKSEVEALCEFLGESFEASMLEFYRDNTPYPTDETNLANLARPILRDNAGRWRTELRPREVRWVEVAASDQMRDLGYVPEHSHASVSSLERAWISGVEAPVTRVLGMLSDHRGQQEGFQKKWFPVEARLGRALRRLTYTESSREA